VLNVIVGMLYIHPIIVGKLYVLTMGKLYVLTITVGQLFMQHD
jgi:hypothetical protein